MRRSPHHTSHTRLGSGSRSELCVEGELAAGDEFVHHVHSGAEVVVSGPLLGQSHAEVLHLVLGLQVAGHLARVDVGAPSCGELDTSCCLGLNLVTRKFVKYQTYPSKETHIKLEKSEVVSFAEHITGLTSKSSILRWGHL